MSSDGSNVSGWEAAIAEIEDDGDKNPTTAAEPSSRETPPAFISVQNEEHQKQQKEPAPQQQQSPVPSPSSKAVIGNDTLSPWTLVADDSPTSGKVGAGGASSAFSPGSPWSTVSGGNEEVKVSASKLEMPSPLSTDAGLPSTTTSTSAVSADVTNASTMSPRPEKPPPSAPPSSARLPPVSPASRAPVSPASRAPVSPASRAPVPTASRAGTSSSIIASGPSESSNSPTTDGATAKTASPPTKTTTVTLGRARSKSGDSFISVQRTEIYIRADGKRVRRIRRKKRRQGSSGGSVASYESGGGEVSCGESVGGESQDDSSHKSAATKTQACPSPTLSLPSSSSSLRTEATPKHTNVGGSEGSQKPKSSPDEEEPSPAGKYDSSSAKSHLDYAKASLDSAKTSPSPPTSVTPEDTTENAKEHPEDTETKMEPNTQDDKTNNYKGKQETVAKKPDDAVMAASHKALSALTSSTKPTDKETDRRPPPERRTATVPEEQQASTSTTLRANTQIQMQHTQAQQQHPLSPGSAEAAEAAANAATQILASRQSPPLKTQLSPVPATHSVVGISKNSQSLKIQQGPISPVSSPKRWASPGAAGGAYTLPPHSPSSRLKQQQKQQQRQQQLQQQVQQQLTPPPQPPRDIESTHNAVAAMAATIRAALTTSSSSEQPPPEPEEDASASVKEPQSPSSHLSSNSASVKEPQSPSSHLSSCSSGRHRRRHRRRRQAFSSSSGSHYDDTSTDGSYSDGSSDSCSHSGSSSCTSGTFSNDEDPSQGGRMWEEASREAERMEREKSLSPSPMNAAKTEPSKFAESLMARTRSRADPNALVVMPPPSSEGVGEVDRDSPTIVRISGGQLSTGEEVVLLRDALTRKRVRLVQLLIIGLISLLFGFLGNLFVLGSCHFATASVEVGQNDRVFQLHYGMFKYTPMDSVFEGYTYCYRYDDAYTSDAPLVPRIAALLALFLGMYSLSVLWTYLVLGRAARPFWYAGIVTAVLAGISQGCTLLFLVGAVCRRNECSLGNAGLLSVFTTIVWFLLAYELSYNMPPDEKVVASIEDEGLVHLEMVDLERGARAYWSRITFDKEIPSLNQRQRENENPIGEEMMSMGMSPRGSYKPPTPILA